MKLFALFSTTGQPIADTCLCEAHLDKQSVIPVPLDAALPIWNSVLPLNTLKCIWCGATDALEEFKKAPLEFYPATNSELDRVREAHDALSEQLENPDAQPHVTHDLAVRLCLALNDYYATL